MSNQLSNDERRQRRTTPDTEPQASQATRQTRRGASWLRDEEVTPTAATRLTLVSLGREQASELEAMVPDPHRG
jgi:hypothetical protein